MPRKKNAYVGKLVKLGYSPYEEFEELSRVRRTLVNRGLDEDIWKLQYERYVEFAKTNDSEYLEYVHWSLLQLNMYIWKPIDEGTYTVEEFNRHLEMHQELCESLSQEEYIELGKKFAEYRDSHHVQGKPFYAGYYWFLKEKGWV